MKEKVNCTKLANQLLSRGVPCDNVLKQVQKYSPKPENWKLSYIELLLKKIQNSYNQGPVSSKSAKTDSKTTDKKVKKQKEKKEKIKNCQYPGCGKEYVGHPITKFCEYHRDIKNREVKKKENTAVNEDNRIIDHVLEDITEMSLICSLDGCEKKYEVEILPKQYIYPKYCEEHRNKFKRDQFLKKFKK